MAAYSIFMLDKSTGAIANSVIESPTTCVAWPAINEQIMRSIVTRKRASSFEQCLPNPFPTKIVGIHKDIKYFGRFNSIRAKMFCHINVRS